MGATVFVSGALYATVLTGTIWLGIPAGFLFFFAIILPHLPKNRIAAFAVKYYTTGPMGVALAGAYIWSFAVRDELWKFSSDFFGVCAQIIPVLLLTTVVEARRDAGLPTVTLVGPLAILTTGEVVALAGILKPSWGLFPPVAGAMTGGVAALILSVLAADAE